MQNPITNIDLDGQNTIVIGGAAGGVVAGPPGVVVGGLIGAGILFGGYIYYQQCQDAEEECKQEVADCKALCRRAQNDPDMKNIWGGSWAQCLLGCVSWRCMNFVD